MNEQPQVSMPIEAPAPVHPSLKAQCEARKAELEDALGRLNGGSETTRRDIEVALDALNGLLTGNLDQIPPIVAGQLSKWISSSKYLGARETREMAAIAIADGVVAENDEVGAGAQVAEPEAKLVAGSQFYAPDAD